MTHARRLLAVLGLVSAGSIAAGDEFFIGEGDVAGLIAVINEANNNFEADTIHLAGGTIYELSQVDNVDAAWGPNGLPMIQSDMTIEGNGAVIARNPLAPGNPYFRLLEINFGTVTLNNLELRGGDVSEEDTFYPGGGVLISSGNVTLNNCTISECAADNNGGGMYVTGASALVTLTDSTIANNEASSGGGVCITAGELTLVRSAVTGNTSFGGGGIQSFGGSMTLTDSTVSSNSADYGGGINSSSDLTITGCDFVDNDASFWGGGIYLVHGAASISSSTIQSNSAGTLGGGILNNDDAAVTVTDSTIRENTAGQHGGGINQWSTGALNVVRSTISNNFADFRGGGFYIALDCGLVSITNSTISQNDTGFEGGGIRTSSDVTLTHVTMSDNTAGSGGGIARSEGAVTLRNSIVAHSSGGDVSGFYTDAGHNIVESGMGLSDPTSMAGDPMMGPLEENGGPTLTHALLEGSPAIDAGECDVALDQRGEPRPQGSSCDIGSFEAESNGSGCPADVNGDGMVDFFDVQAFLNLYAASDPGADFNHDTLIDFFDIQSYLNAYAAGCP